MIQVRAFIYVAFFYLWSLLASLVMLPTLLGLFWAALSLRLPGPVAAYMNIFADALTACALFAIGLALFIIYAA